MSIPIQNLEGNQIDYWYLRACGYSTSEVEFDSQGYLIFYINDDYHPPGFFFWNRHELTEKDMIAQIVKYYGTMVPG
jgi:hypothetical protein